MGEIDKLYEYFRDKNYFHVSLLQKIVSDSNAQNSNVEASLFIENNLEDIITGGSTSDFPRDPNVLLSAKEHQESWFITINQEMMVEVAYTSPFQAK